ncbi:MAG TPA: S8 family serine peptidase [Vicinamibacterales bacterium]
MILRTLRLFAVIACALACATPSAAQPSSGKLDRALHDALESGARRVRVIITVKPGYRSEIRRALESHGDVVRSEHPLVNALAAEVHSEDLAELGRHPWIESVSIDAVVHAGAAPIRGAGAPAASSLREIVGLSPTAESHGPTGATVGVAVVDSGIAPTVDFANRIAGFYDFTRGGIPVVPSDAFGHGTHVAGLIGGGGSQAAKQFQGIAPDVRFVGFKVLDKTGTGNTSDVIKAIEYIVANHVALKVQIINLSLGHPIYESAKTDPLVQAVEKATANGLIVVASAGNYGENEKTGKIGYTGVTSPGNAPSAITVGATETGGTITRTDDAVAPYSSRGPTWFDALAKPDLVAPGHHLVSETDVNSTLFKQLASSRRTLGGQAFLELSGSSMAAAVTTGLAALIVDAHNRAAYLDSRPLTPNTVKAILEYTAIPLTGFDHLTEGTGEINSSGAIALASAIDTSAAPAAWWLRAGIPMFTVIGGGRDYWSQEIIWGDTLLSGQLLFERAAAWMPGAVWGSNAVWRPGVAEVEASSVVWGAGAAWCRNIVWSNRLIGQKTDGENIVWGASQGLDNIVWGTVTTDNVVWGTMQGDNIVWGTVTSDNIVWGTSHTDNVVWGTSDDDNVVWGTGDGNNVVWGTIARAGGRR